ncbi:uncharacterized protein F4822DRAFT_31326 [Hypoxylon trugodes]|uniref:uncharacterized protein n=1 Tax=Hypoxylon trugodes TaxID=326681 RepID=UPI0021A14360|nr:uncharacterized protein F4822DRAFT_31326 [Hypoxylon trugodes]KAI1393947.1 hypothetical protein F4822DRAFT_31326 [Hypoxylon trugodes]
MLFGFFKFKCYSGILIMLLPCCHVICKVYPSILHFQFAWNPCIKWISLSNGLGMLSMEPSVGIEFSGALRKRDPHELFIGVQFGSFRDHAVLLSPRVAVIEQTQFAAIHHGLSIRRVLSNLSSQAIHTCTYTSHIIPHKIQLFFSFFSHTDKID